MLAKGLEDKCAFEGTLAFLLYGKMMSNTLLKSRRMTYCIKNVPSPVHKLAVFEYLGGERLAFRVSLVHQHKK